MKKQDSAILSILTIFFLLIFSPPVFAQGESLQVLNDTAVSLYEQGKYSDAAELAERALKVAEDTLGPYNPQLASFLNNLAVIYYAQGRYAEAEALYERALGITEPSLGSDHPRILSLMQGIQKCQQKLSEQAPPEDSDESEESAELTDESLPDEPEQEPPLTDDTMAREEAHPGQENIVKKLYTVQVGAFKNLLNAKALQDRLDSNGYDVSITTVTTQNGESLHKVQIGELEKLKKAELLAEEIRTLMGLDTYITTK